MSFASKTSVRQLAVAALVAACTSCSDGVAELRLVIESTLEMPTQTDTLVLQLKEDNTNAVTQTYDRLGTGDLTAWPLYLPVTAKSGPRPVTIMIELRHSARPNSIVGYREARAEIPAVGQSVRHSILVQGACSDEDGDGFFVGYDCLNPDCDDSRSSVPSTEPCGDEDMMREPISNPIGMRDAGQADAVADAGANDTATPDTGVVVDSGVDAGTPISCGPLAPCPAGQVCSGLIGTCMPACVTAANCPHSNYVCLPSGHCACSRLCAPINPVDATQDRCEVHGGGTCIDECCTPI